ncbi:MAG: divergent polysaccharide deacetylase family protein [Rhodospirillales bacterium]
MRSGRGAADKDRTRITDSNKRESAARRPGYRLSPVRQAIFVGLALIGIGAGYGIGYLTNKQSPQPQERAQRVADATGPAAAKNGPVSDAAPAATATVSPNRPLLPENGKAVQGSPVRAYEEALPKNVVEPHVSPPTSETATPVTPPAAEITRPVPAPPPVARREEPAPAPSTSASAVPESTGREPVAALPKDVEKMPAAAMPSAAAVGSLPAWKRFAVAVPAAAGRPRIAIVIDDLGVDKPRTARTIRLRPPLTLSFLTYASGLKELTAAAHVAGHELMMHIPMEPGSPDVDPGPNVLLTGVPRNELQASLKWNLDQFEGYVGINNHMGSRFTADLAGMLVVMEELKKRDLLFLDSITAFNSTAGKAAHQVGVPFTRRNIFLDHDDNVSAIKKQLAEVERMARRSGSAVAIGHPREATLQALIPWLSEVEGRGFQLVPVSALIRPPAPRG